MELSRPPPNGNIRGDMTDEAITRTEHGFGDAPGHVRRL